MKDNSWLIILIFALILIGINYCTKCDDRLKDITSTIDSIVIRPDTFVVNKVKTDTILVNKFYVLRDTVRVIDTVRILREFGEYREYKIDTAGVKALIDLLYNAILSINLLIKRYNNSGVLNLGSVSTILYLRSDGRAIYGAYGGYDFIGRYPVCGVSVGVKW